jgi:hypothetical protein
MSNNKRIFYACQALAITNEGDETIARTDMVHGVQSVGINTSFNLEQVFELGQVEIYENIEGTPDIEVTLEKVIDGYPLIYHMATVGVVGTSNSGIVGRADTKCDLRLGIFDAQKSNVASATDNSGKSEVEIYCSGMFVSSISYTVPVDGNCTESVTLVGNNKRWLTLSDVKIEDDDVAAFNGTNSPKALGFPGAASGGVQRREDVMLSGSILPRLIQGVVDSPSGAYGNGLAATGPRVHIQNFTCSTDFGREDILELGRKSAFFRPATFPVEVTCEIEAITSSGDFIDALEVGAASLTGTVDSGNNLRNEPIFLLLRCGVAFDLGNKNKLTSVSYGGGDAGGGNVSCSYSFQNFNSLDVQDIANGYIGFGINTLNATVTGGKYASNIGYGAFPTNLMP